MPVTSCMLVMMLMIRSLFGVGCSGGFAIVVAAADAAATAAVMMGLVVLVYRDGWEGWWLF